MSSVYGNSLWNIAALGLDGADTCFAQRNPLQVFPCNITPQKEGNSIYAGPETDKDMPLLRRGRVMQERLLPPRVIYTGAKQLFWECCSGTASEGIPSLTGKELAEPKHASSLARYLSRKQYCAKSDFELLCG